MKSEVIRFGSEATSMIDIDSLTIDVLCPQCGFFNTVTLKQIRIRDVVICRGCKVSVLLEDHLNSTRKSVRAIRRSLRQLEEQLAAIGTITLRL